MHVAVEKPQVTANDFGKAIPAIDEDRQWLLAGQH